MNLLNSYRQWRSYHRTVNELNKLSRRELDDLGLSYSDIPRVARSHARGN